MERKYLVMFVFLGMLLFPVLTTNTSISDISININATIHTISYDDVPAYSDQLITENALNDSVAIWNDLNNHIYFVIVESDADVNISWIDSMDNSDLGTYTTSLNNNGGWYDHYISISLGTYGCDSKHYLYSYQSLRQTIMHEMGHYLGLEHINNINHLMYSPESFDVYSIDTYDDMNYIIPQIENLNFQTTDASNIINLIDYLHEELLILQSLGFGEDGEIISQEHAQLYEELRERIYELDVIIVCIQSNIEL